MNQTNYVDMFQSNVKSRMKDAYFYHKSATSQDFKPTSIFMGVIIGVIICKLTNS